MKASPILEIVAAACVVVLAVAGCRERQVPDGPAPMPAGMRDPSAPIAIPAVAMDENALKAAALSSAPCSFDSVDMRFFKGTLAVDKSHPVQLRGWLSNTRREPAGEFRLVLDGGSSAWSIAASTGVARPDVSDYFRIPALGTAGFEIPADLATVPAGVYSIMLVFDADGTLLACDAGKRLQLQ